jgi:transcriptional regulator with XRE-family HTH domain
MFPLLTSQETLDRIHHTLAEPKGAFYEQLGQSLTKARRQRRLTQSRLAAAVSVSRTSITNIEKGRQVVPAHLLAKLAQTLNVPIADLVPANDGLDAGGGVDLQLSALKPEQREWATRVIARRQSEANHEDS